MLTDTQLVGEICIQFAKYIVRLQSYAEWIKQTKNLQKFA